MPGPLSGIRIVEIAGIGPVPFAGMMLSDFGASIIRVDRYASESSKQPRPRLMGRNRRSISVNLKTPEGQKIVRDLIADSDALLEGWRPGVAERLGIGPEQCLKDNERLVYGRMTGWGQSGPLSERAGHDINYVGLSGVLNAIGQAGGKPTPPLNLLGDFGGGGMLLAFGVACALLEARQSGKGQVIDAAMLDGVQLLATSPMDAFQSGLMTERRGENLVDSGSPFYDCYICSDGKYVILGALEDEFFNEFCKLAFGTIPARRHDPSTWPQLRAKIAAFFLARTRDEWIAFFKDSDSCVSPVLSWSEVADDPHVKARGNLIERDGKLHPAPAPRLSRTPGSIQSASPSSGLHTDAILAELGFSETAIADLRTRKIVS